MVSSNNLKNILSGLFNKNKEEHDKDINRLDTNMNKGWISSGTIDDIRGDDTTNDTPVGTVISIMGNNAPLHYLVCDGTEYNISDYPELTKYFEIEFGTINYFGGDGIDTFAVPDLRGEFLRGSGTNSHDGNGSGAAVGKHQNGTKQIYFGVNTSTKVIWTDTIAKYNNTSDPQVTNAIDADARLNLTNNTSNTGFKTGTLGTWTNASGTSHFVARPTNTSVLYCIKYESTKLLSISMYDGTHYSTEELLIGQWIDGKPLYRKVIEINKFSNGFNEIPHGITNLERLVDLKGSGYRTTPENDFAGWYIIPILSEGNSNQWYLYPFGTKDSTIRIYAGGSIYNQYSNICITLEYTKTTDESFSTTEDIAWVALDSEVDDIINKLGE